jgi:hypothetical protein
MIPRHCIHVLNNHVHMVNIRVENHIYIMSLLRTDDHSNAKDQDERLHWYRAPRTGKKTPSHVHACTSTLQLIPPAQTLLHHACQRSRDLVLWLANLDNVLFWLFTVTFASTVSASSSGSESRFKSRGWRRRRRSERRNLPVEGDLGSQASDLVALFGVHVGKNGVGALFIC